MTRIIALVFIIAVSVLCAPPPAAAAEKLSVSPAVAEKAARDAQELRDKGQIEDELLEPLPGDSRVPGLNYRSSLRGIRADNKRIQNNMRSINNSIRDMNIKINRINSRRF